MCQTSNTESLHKNSPEVQSVHLINNINKNGSIHKSFSKIEDSFDRSLGQKHRKMDSSEASNNNSTQRNQGLNSSSQNKMYNQPANQNDTDKQPTKSSSLDHSDRKNGQISNLQNTKAKMEGGMFIVIFKAICVNKRQYLIYSYLVNNKNSILLQSIFRKQK